MEGPGRKGLEGRQGGSMPSVRSVYMCQRPRSMAVCFLQLHGGRWSSGNKPGLVACQACITKREKQVMS